MEWVTQLVQDDLTQDLKFHMQGAYFQMSPCCQADVIFGGMDGTLQSTVVTF
jgi:hypothetical protein